MSFIGLHISIVSSLSYRCLLCYVTNNSAPAGGITLISIRKFVAQWFPWRQLTQLVVLYGYSFAGTCYCACQYSWSLASTKCILFGLLAFPTSDPLIHVIILLISNIYLMFVLIRGRSSQSILKRPFFTHDHLVFESLWLYYLLWYNS